MQTHRTVTKTHKPTTRPTVVVQKKPASLAQSHGASSKNSGDVWESF